MDIKEVRREYPDEGFRRENLPSTPYDLLKNWIEEAITRDVIEVNAMSLATASKEGRPSCRVVLLKHFDERGLVFYTNLGSRKASEIEENPWAAVTIFWHELMRQICIEGSVEKLSEAESATYFRVRPRGSQLGAWASEQGKILENREVLENKHTEVSKRFDEGDVPLPPFWGGYRIRPTRYEFWVGRQNRLHDRFQYVKLDKGTSSEWKIERIAP